jgi:hypothetical protein
MIKHDWKQVKRALSPGQKSEEVPFTEHEFIEQYAKKAYEQFGEGKLAVEVGAYCGSSTAIIAQFFKVVTIDLWYPLENYSDATIGDNFPNFMNTWKKFNLRGRVFPLLGSTNVLKEILTSSLHASFCFIDGDHSYEGTMSDLLFCNTHLVPNGYMVVHDYPRADTITRAVDEFAKDHHYTVLEVCGDGVIALQKGEGL